MKKIIFLASLIIVTGISFAQKKTTTSGIVSFDATTSEDKYPKADNKTAIASIDTKKGTVAFEVVMKNFTFSNPKMQEHFNGASFLNSEKYPTANFKGNITNLPSINFMKDGTYSADVDGMLTIRGETKKVKTTSTLIVKGEVINATAAFTIKLDDYKITGSAITSGKVSNEPKITVSAELK